MNFRSNKVFDFVAVEKNFKESVKKSESIRMQWIERFEWMLDDYKYLFF